MAGRGWVYRRPVEPRRRRFVPLTRPAQDVSAPPILRRLRLALRRRHAIRRRIPIVYGVAAAAAAQAPVVIRRVRPASRVVARIRRHAPQVFGVAAPVAPGVGMVFIRMLRAVTRMRRKMRQRLHWRQAPELPPSFDRIESPQELRTFTSGLLRGRTREGLVDGG